MSSERLNELFGGSLENVEACAAAVRVEAGQPATVACARELRGRAFRLIEAADALARKLGDNEHLLAEGAPNDE